MLVAEHPHFKEWLTRLRDLEALGRIQTRLRRIQRDGNLGQTRSVGGKVWEIKLDFGPGYRLYYTQRGAELILLLAGGDKSTQRQDILEAQRLAASLLGGG